jgi:hypothetical protein
VAIGLFISSCSTDVDVIGEWEETMIVYGLLNQNDTAHYVKVTKAFLGEENALVMAQEYDSSYYGSELQVSLQRKKNGNVVETITLERDETIEKESGTFSYPNQVLYKTTQTIYDDSEYAIEIENTSSGNIASASTSLVKSFSIDKPKTTESVNWNLIGSDYKVKWQSAINGKMYQLTIRFHYSEQNKTTLVTTAKYIDWVFTSEQSSTTDGGEDMEVAIDGQTFYTFLASMIDVDPNVIRTIGTLDFTITVAGADFTTYMDVNQPSSGVLQEKPIYTNIENGIGIFSSRFEKSVNDLSMVTSTQDSIRYGIHTENLSFQ